MSVSFNVKDSFYEIGTGSFLFSFFSTICYQLENKKWGSKYPLLMLTLYSDAVEVKDIPILKKELLDIKQELTKFPPTAIIWDIENLDALPPWGDNISHDITNLSEYFVSSAGVSLFTVLENALTYAQQTNANISVVSI